jgi:predicted nuclease with TOPRIM domain
VTSSNQQREQQLAEERAEHGICKEQLAGAKDVNDRLWEELQQSKEELRVAQQRITSLEANLSLMRETNQSLEHHMTRLAGDLAIYRGDVALIDSLSSSRVKDLAADLAHTAELVA